VPQFTQIPIQAASGITALACGEDFSLALSRSGNVYSTGLGDYGIHGIGMGETEAELADRWAF